MKFDSVVAASVSLPGIGGTSETEAARRARMTALWSNPNHATLIPIGKFLASEAGGKSFAQWLIDGESIELDHVMSEGVRLPLAAGFVMSLKNVTSTWGCIACRSAHGSGVKPSKGISLKGLVNNRFYYNPTTQGLVTISDTCWKTYVSDLGAVTDSRFIGAAAWHAKQVPTEQVPTEQVPTEQVPTEVFQSRAERRAKK
jgi:hypothetical protein